MNQMNFNDIGDRIKHIEMILDDLGDISRLKILQMFVKSVKGIEQDAHKEYLELIDRVKS